MSDLYARRGVSSGKEDVHAAISHLDKGLYPNAFCKILPDYFAHSSAHACLLHTDTAGTKPILAYLYWRETGDLDVWKGIVEDALVMNLDDMACAGMTTGFVVSSNIARNKARIPGEVLGVLIAHADAYLNSLRKYGIEAWLAGGETADVGDLVRTLDVGYTVAGRMARDEVMEINIQPGQVIVGVASSGQASYEQSWNSGIGSNGLTSARHDLLSSYYKVHYPETLEPSLEEAVTYAGKYRLTDPIAGVPVDVGHMILSPTRTYLPLLRPLLAEYRSKIGGLIHCTGGGQTKCLHFAPQGVHIVKDNLMEIPVIFREIQAAMHTPWKEMYRTFNMGHRLEIYTDADTAQVIIEQAASLHLQAQVVGRVEPGAGPKATLAVHHAGQVLQYP
ncbi:MAG: AIR synthase-related protein [Sphingobacteriia bacterium]